MKIFFLYPLSLEPFFFSCLRARSAIWWPPTKHLSWCYLYTLGELGISDYLRTDYKLSVQSGPLTAVSPVPVLPLRCLIKIIFPLLHVIAKLPIFFHPLSSPQARARICDRIGPVKVSFPLTWKNALSHWFKVCSMSPISFTILNSKHDFFGRVQYPSFQLWTITERSSRSKWNV